MVMENISLKHDETVVDLLKDTLNENNKLRKTNVEMLKDLESKEDEICREEEKKNQYYNFTKTYYELFRDNSETIEALEQNLYAINCINRGLLFVSILSFFYFLISVDVFKDNYSFPIWETIIIFVTLGCHYFSFKIDLLVKSTTKENRKADTNRELFHNFFDSMK